MDQGPRRTVERELKLTAPPGFQLPVLPGEPLAARTFTSTYFDTADFRLARSGVTLRRRVEQRRGLWQLKLPLGEARLELESPGGAAGPPERLRGLLTAYLRGEQLEPVAKLRTRRTGVRVREDSSGPVADVTVDAVTLLVDGRVKTSFRELEAELVEGDEKILRRLEKTLRKAGAAEGDARPKLLQALGLPAGRPPAAPARSAPLTEHLAAALGAQYRAILEHDPGTRLGSDAEELHQLRVATRRARAFLRAARPLLEHDWAESLRVELGWLGSVLGPVRDVDVLSAYLLEDEAGLEPRTIRVLRRLFALLETEREEARAAMLEALDSPRYVDLLDQLEDAARAPRVLEGTRVSPRALARDEFRRLRKAVADLGPDPSDEALHAVRIRGKRARYAAELAEPMLGKRGAKLIREAKVLQDLLGAHQDAVFAEERIRSLAKQAGGQATAFAAGQLVERERARRLEARAAFRKSWNRLERTGRELWK